MKPPLQALALLAAAVPLGLVVLGAGAARTRASGPTSAVEDTDQADSDAAALGLGRPLPALEPAPVSMRRPAPGPEAERSRPLSVAERAPRAVRELAALLLSEPFDRPGFERAVGALAAGLTDEDVGALADRLRRADAPLAERLAAGELLREREPRFAPLPPSLRDELLGLACAPGRGALPESAACLLVALGSGAERRALVEALASADGSVRARCARALTSAQALEAREREALRLDLEEALARTPDERAAGILAGLEARLAPRVPADPEALARTLLAPEAGPGARFGAAEALARDAGDLPFPTRRLAHDVLVARTASSAPHERRRALYALASLGEADALAPLAEAARFDPEPGVRAAGVRALRGFPAAEPTLTAIAAADPSPEVRSQARQELAWRARGADAGPTARRP